MVLRRAKNEGMAFQNQIYKPYGPVFRIISKKYKKWPIKDEKLNLLNNFAPCKKNDTKSKIVAAGYRAVHCIITPILQLNSLKRKTIRKT